MAEASFTITYWHLDTEADMIPVVKQLLPFGYSGTVTGAMQPSLNAEDNPIPVERWMLSLIAPGGTVLPADLGDVVVWNGFTAQVMPRADFEAMVNPGS